MNRLVIALSIASLSITLARADDSSPPGDLARLQGTWTAMVGPERDIPITLEVQKQKVTINGKRPGGEDFTLKGELKLDEKASPKTIDWVKFVGAQGNEAPENLGLYKLEGDTLTVCSGGPGGERPTEFKKGDGGPPQLITFARKKDGAAKDEAKGDHSKLQGDWKTMVGPNKDRPVTFAIKDRSIAVKYTTDEGQVLNLKGEFAINESASPRTIDFVKFKNEGEDMDDTHGLYKVEGDTLTLCVSGPGEPRPSEFKAGDGGEQPGLWIFTRPKYGTLDRGVTSMTIHAAACLAILALAPGDDKPAAKGGDAAGLQGGLGPARVVRANDRMDVRDRIPGGDVGDDDVHPQRPEADRPGHVQARRGRQAKGPRPRRLPRRGHAPPALTAVHLRRGRRRPEALRPRRPRPAPADRIQVGRLGPVADRAHRADAQAACAVSRTVPSRRAGARGGTRALTPCGTGT